MTLFVRQPLPSTAAWFIYNYCPDLVYFPALVFMCIVEVTKSQQMLLLVQQMLLLVQLVSESTAATPQPYCSHTAAILQPQCSHNETLALRRLPVSAVDKLLLQVVLPPLVLAWGPGVLSQFLGCALILLMLGIQLTGLNS